MAPSTQAPRPKLSSAKAPVFIDVHHANLQFQSGEELVSYLQHHLATNEAARTNGAVLINVAHLATPAITIPANTNIIVSHQDVRHGKRTPNRNGPTAFYLECNNEVDAGPDIESYTDSDGEKDWRIKRARTLQFPAEPLTDRGAALRKMNDIMARAAEQVKFKAPYVLYDLTDRHVRVQSGFRLSCGARMLLFSPTIQGVQSPFGYESQGETFFIAHIEDFDLDAYNILFAGEPKLWVTVSPEHKEAFESAVRHAGFTSGWNGGKRGNKPKNVLPKCSRKMNHVNIWPTLELMDEWEVDYKIILQKPGQLVAVTANTYHWGVNLGVNYAEAGAFCPSDNFQIPSTWKTCGPLSVCPEEQKLPGLKLREEVANGNGLLNSDDEDARDQDNDDEQLEDEGSSLPPGDRITVRTESSLSRKRGPGDQAQSSNAQKRGRLSARDLAGSTVHAKRDNARTQSVRQTAKRDNARLQNFRQSFITLCIRHRTFESLGESLKSLGREMLESSPVLEEQLRATTAAYAQAFTQAIRERKKNLYRKTSDATNSRDAELSQKAEDAQKMAYQMYTKHSVAALTRVFDVCFDQVLVYKYHIQTLKGLLMRDTAGGGWRFDEQTWSRQDLETKILLYLYLLKKDSKDLADDYIAKGVWIPDAKTLKREMTEKQRLERDQLHKKLMTRQLTSFEMKRAAKKIEFQKKQRAEQMEFQKKQDAQQMEFQEKQETEQKALEKAWKTM